MVKKIGVEPLGKRVIVIRKETVTETEGGIILPEVAQRDEPEGVIVSVGEECKWLRVGDTVILPEHTGSMIQVRGQKAIVVLEDDIQVRISEV